jgi:acetyl-CoA carboxylase biotin carboxyl carrier protein
MDIRKIKKLIEVLEESNIGEIEIREGDESVRLTRASSDSVPFRAGDDAQSKAAAKDKPK